MTSKSFMAISYAFILASVCIHGNELDSVYAVIGVLCSIAAIVAYDIEIRLTNSSK